MMQIVKLILLYFGYQLLAGAVMTGISLVCPLGLGVQLGWSLLLSGVVMIIHLIAFKYVNLRQALAPVSLPTLLVSVGCILSAMLCFNALSELVGLPDLLEEHFIALSQTVTGVLSVALVAPFVEELVFRGAIMRHLQERGLSPRMVILVSALLFGIVHVNPVQVLFAFLMGLVLGWIAWRTGSLVPVVVGHILNNATGVMELYISGNGEKPIGTMEELSVPVLVALAVIGLLLTILLGMFLQYNIRKKGIKDIE